MRGLSEAEKFRISLSARRYVAEVSEALCLPVFWDDDPDLQGKIAQRDRFMSTIAAGYLLEELQKLVGSAVAAGGAAAAVAHRVAVDPSIRDEVLIAINVDARELFACSRQDVARFRTLQDIADTLAGLQTDEELQEDDGDGMSGDDASAALSNLITWGRQVSHEGPTGAEPVAPFHAAWMKTVEHVKATSDAFPFAAEVPGHVAPEEGEP